METLTKRHKYYNSRAATYGRGLGRLPPFFTAVAFLSTWTAVSIGDDIGAAKSPEEQRRALSDRIDTILGSDDFADPFEIVEVEPEKLKAAVELLRASESLFPKSDPEVLDRYVSWRFV